MATALLALVACNTASSNRLQHEGGDGTVGDPSVANPAAVGMQAAPETGRDASVDAMALAPIGPDRSANAHASETDAGAPVPADAGAAAPSLDDALARLIAEQGLTGDPATPRGLHRIRPTDSALVRLGQVLFFSQSLSGGFDVACGTCHHPDFAGADALSLSVGVAPLARSVVGPGRHVDATRDLDPLADGGPNMHRNSPTTFNAALFDRELLADGRVYVQDSDVVYGGLGQGIRTPESGNGIDMIGASGLLETMAKFPTVNDNEMRGFLYTDLAQPDVYREHLLDRMRGLSDTALLKPDAAARWLELFRAGFEQPDADAAKLITMLNVEKALAAFVSSQIFVDTPFRKYVQGDAHAIDDDEKRGAFLFLAAPDDGGLGCSGCHSGDRFTSEEFRNVGFPQIGRGFRRADRRDVGRWFVEREPYNWMTFRVPSLLNVALTAPYGHAGAFPTLQALLQYHANPRAAVETFDFSLQDLAQFKDSGLEYPYAEQYTREAIASPTFAQAEPDLPRRDLSSDELRELTAFLSTLTDPCAADPACRGAWTPDAALDPDGHMLVRDDGSTAPEVDAERPADYAPYIDFEYQPTKTRTTFADTVACDNGLQSALNEDAPLFENVTAERGVTAPHGFSPETWDPGAVPADVEAVMIAGGASAAYLDDDCWPDIAYAGGDSSGLVFYHNAGAQRGYVATDMLGDELRASLGTRYSNIATADLNGDYRRELVIGNLKAHALPILSQNDAGMYYLVASLPMTRNTFGISFGLLDPAGYPDMYLGHWAFSGAPGTAPAFWKNTGGYRLQPYDDIAKTSSAYVDQPLNFTPKFVDFTGDGLQDLVVSSDFGTTRTLQNVGGVEFDDVTDTAVITDENGMGGAIGDFDNDGKLDWFVTSVRDPSQPLGNWGRTGNRLYRNVSTGNRLAFEDVTQAAGVRDGSWGWGACAADFNQDGFLDIFHVNGFGYIPDSALPGVSDGVKTLYNDMTSRFQHVPPRLFINDGDGTFSDEAGPWQINVPSEGRSVACFDYDRDGDIDVLLLDQSTGLQLFENQIGHGSGRHFLNVRVVGAAPNTEALGARVAVTADVGHGHGVQTQVRVSQANSNFNGQDLPALHFGLGSAATVTTLIVTWPGDATPLVCNDVSVNQFLVFDQRKKTCP